ncbi:hypothetical protein RDI58_026583 [Solanum bulbocastanum]
MEPPKFIKYKPCK